MFLEAIKEVFHRPKSNTPALDGMRALAIVAVVAMHVNQYYFEYGYSKTIINMLPPFKGGWVGVQLFFVLSGYLIGGQIWSEYIETKRFNFLRFFIRRGLRIWPLYYFILIIFILFPLGEVNINGIISNLFFLSNYWPEKEPLYGAWSLATEEHFYILAPLFLILTSKIFGQRELKFYRKILWISLLVPIATRYLTWHFLSPYDEFHLITYMKIIYRPIHTNCEGLIIGMLISNYIKDSSFSVSGFLKNRNLILLFTTLFMIASFLDKLYFNFLGIALCFGAFLWKILDDNSLLTKTLSHPLWFPIAKTSFGIYLIHMPLIKVIYSSLGSILSNMNSMAIPFFMLAIAIFTSIIICIFLYVIIEKPFLLFRKRILKKL